MSEIWKPVVGYEGFYEISDAGNVRSLDRTIEHRDVTLPYKGRMLKKTVASKYGHLKVTFCVDKREAYRFIHHLVLEAFVGPCPAGLEGCHNDGIPSHNWPDNLRWDTRLNNMRDRLRHGTSNRGSRHGCSKLTESDVIAIRRDIALGKTKSALAKEYVVNRSTISHIFAGRTWTHLSG